MLVVEDLLSLFLLASACSASPDIVDLLGVDGGLALLLLAFVLVVVGSLSLRRVVCAIGMLLLLDDGLG